jgi:hypothetical protein
MTYFEQYLFSKTGEIDGVDGMALAVAQMARAESEGGSCVFLTSAARAKPHGARSRTNDTSLLSH